MPRKSKNRKASKSVAKETTNQTKNQKDDHIIQEPHEQEQTKITNKINKNNKELERPFRWDPFSELIQRRLGTAIIIILIALFCDVFSAKRITEVQRFNELMQKATGVNFENTFNFFNASIPTGSVDPKLRPGYILAQQGAKASNPVVLIPGFITSGLELWAGEECAKRHFRQRLWGSFPIFIRFFSTDMKCWSRHLQLDPITGGDPENIKLRSALGFEAADYFMNTYWVWDKMIENLADVGYDSSNMMMMSYDWRLSFPMLEKRDGYLTKLKVNIEAFAKTTGMPVVIASHSMGSQIVLYFFKWVTTPEELGGGGGGEDWVEKNCAKFVNIAGPMLGVPKAVPALLSGEMKDTAALFGPMGNVMERLFGKKDRRELWTTWGSLWEMLPKGGTDIWGTSHDIITSVLNNDEELVSKYHNSASIDDHDMVCLDDGCSSSAIEHIHSKDGSHLEVQDSLASFITFNDELTSFENESDHLFLDAEGIGNNGYRPNDKAWTINDAIAFLIKSGGGYGESLHASRSVSPRPESESWNNPLATPLPSAPSMKMYCLYGVGIETERAYYYRKTIPDLNILNGGSDVEIPTYETHLPYIMDASVNEPERHVHFGTRSSDGDVSVPLISLGYMCVDKWQNSKTLNPSNINITTREYKHREEFQVNDPMRGGPHSADHVDILGNVDAVTDLLKIVTDFETDGLEDQIVSDIVSISKKISKHNAL